MATVSYAAGLDSRVLDFKPHDLPWETILKEHSIKTQQFAQSAAQIQQAHQRNLDLAPLFEGNKEYLKQYMLDATKQLDRYAKSDLTIQDNNKLATGLFTSIFDTKKNPQSESLLLDDNLNKYYQAENQKEEAAKKANGGKNWSQKNAFFYRKGQEDYTNAARDGNIDALKDLSNNRKAFIPYYDAVAEIKDIQKLCSEKSNSITTPKTGTGYLITQGGEGAGEQEFRNCLSSGLSNQAKTQFMIDGYADYYNDHGSLLRDYRDFELGAVEKQLDNFNQQKLILSSKKVLTEEDETQLSQLTDAILQVEKVLDNKTTQYNEAISKPDFIKNNYEQLVGGLTFQKRLDTYARDFNTLKTEYKYAANPVEMQQFKFAFEDGQSYKAYKYSSALSSQDHQQKIELKKIEEGPTSGMFQTAEFNILDATATSTDKLKFITDQYDQSQEMASQSLSILAEAVIQNVDAKLLPTTSKPYSNMDEKEKSAYNIKLLEYAQSLNTNFGQGKNEGTQNVKNILEQLNNYDAAVSNHEVQKNILLGYEKKAGIENSNGIPAYSNERKVSDMTLWERFSNTPMSGLFTYTHDLNGEGAKAIAKETEENFYNKSEYYKKMSGVLANETITAPGWYNKSFVDTEKGEKRYITQVGGLLNNPEGYGKANGFTILPFSNLTGDVIIRLLDSDMKPINNPKLEDYPELAAVKNVTTYGNGFKIPKILPILSENGPLHEKYKEDLNSFASAYTSNNGYSKPTNTLTLRSPGGKQINIGVEKSPGGGIQYIGTYINSKGVKIELGKKSLTEMAATILSN